MFEDPIIDAMHVLVAALFIVAAINDVREFKIPNWISIGMILLFFVRAFVEPIEPQDALWDLSFAFIVLLLGFALYSLKWFGAGDVKLLSAGALWIGIWNDTGASYGGGLLFVLTTMLLGGALAALLLTLVWVRDHVPINGRVVMWIDSVRTYMPYGVAISGAGIYVLMLEIGLF